MLILGINDTHDASAALIRDGKIVIAVAEERIQRVKNMSTFPHHAIRHIFKVTGVTAADLDHVAIATKRLDPLNFYNLVSTFNNKDYLKFNLEYYYPRLYEGRTDLKLRDFFPDYKPAGDMAYPLDQIPFAPAEELGPDIYDRLQAIRRDFTARFLGIDRSKIEFYNHHRAHAVYGYYTDPEKPEGPVAVVTSDGGGDGAYTSIHKVENGRFSLVHEERQSLIGKIYASVTLVLGMDPHRHPYKVMGLAPYATEHHKKQPREIFLAANRVDGIRFVRSSDLKDLFYHFQQRLMPYRFDGIAGAVQDFAEIRLMEWFRNIAKELKTPHFVFSGGVANNVKANMRIAEMDEIASLYIPPGPGDEHLSIGAAYCAMYDKLGPEKAFAMIEPPINAYWGTAIEQADQDEFAAHPFILKHYEAVAGDPYDNAASLLAKGEILALCQGRMEFGARALGNRSFLIDPSNLDAKQRLNAMIKKRDFWMPFTPSILTETYDRYVVNPKNIFSDYMTICFPSTALARDHIKAALHPMDLTLRPQRVSKDRAPRYHKLISSFHEKTGIGGVLNTSLNIHEKPIVARPVEIVHELLVDEQVPLGAMLIEGTLYRRRSG